MFAPGTIMSANERAASLASRRLPGSIKTWLDAAKEAADIEGVDVGEVLAMVKTKAVSRARQRAWAALHDLGYSYPEIADGWKVHNSCACEGARKHFARMSIHSP